LDAETRDRFRRLLLEKRDRLVWQRERAREGDLGQSAGDAISELSTYDNHPADLGTETWARSQELALRARAGEGLVEVEEALGRLRDGTYGYCLSCGRPIEAQRLEALPETPYCRGCREALDRREARDPQRRPIEEEVLSPPFARTFRDGDDDAGYDGEDAWQDVAQYGTSETPSDVPEAHRYPYVTTDPHERRGAVQEVEGLVDAEGEVLDPKNWQT
jgi:YteA family regulatory protein